MAFTGLASPLAKARGLGFVAGGKFSPERRSLCVCCTLLCKQVRTRTPPLLHRTRARIRFRSDPVNRTQHRANWEQFLFQGLDIQIAEHKCSKLLIFTRCYPEHGRDVFLKILIGYNDFLDVGNGIYTSKTSLFFLCKNQILTQLTCCSTCDSPPADRTTLTGWFHSFRFALRFCR